MDSLIRLPESNHLQNKNDHHNQTDQVKNTVTAHRVASFWQFRGSAWIEKKISLPSSRECGAVYLIQRRRHTIEAAFLQYVSA
jgi:hypothetical protein